MSKQKKNYGLWSRVDAQVSILVFAFTLCATIITSIVFWNYTFQVMIVSLEERVYAIYDSVENSMDMDTFLEIDSEEDMDTILYQEAKEELLQLKNAAGVLYLYTAKEDEDGTFIYVIDGLEDDQDFRYPGDLIEEEIIEDMQLALSGVEVIPNEIVHTDWGDIFVAYMPVHDEDGEIIGVVGIEFDASVMYVAYSELMEFVPLIIIMLSLVAALVSVTVFKRISNPFYMDLATKDTPTGLKNRNAYEVDLNNMTVRDQMQDVGIIMIDINNLKLVNDRLGHNAGDEYIQYVAEVLKEYKDDTMVAYRIGGDEFVIIVQDATIDKLQSYIEKCTISVREQKRVTEVEYSISCGCSIFGAGYDRSLTDTCNRADEIMYAAKRKYKESVEQ